MDRKTEAENALIYQIRSAAQRVRESIGAEETSQNRRELNKLGADLLEIRKQNRKQNEKNSIFCRTGNHGEQQGPEK